MRPVSPAFFAISASWMIGVDAQEAAGGIPEELLCDQCPWDAPVNRVLRDGFNSPNATTIITAEDMRNLGVISVADMVNRLPSETAVEPEEASGPELGAPFNLGANIDELRRFSNESTDQSESSDESVGAPTDDDSASTEGQAEE